MKIKFYLAVVALLVAVNAVQAIPTWDTVAWNEVMQGGAGYTDKHWHDDVTDNYTTTPLPTEVDLVGGHDSVSGNDYVTAYWSVDADNIYFRVRVDGDPGPAPQYVWTAVLNTDADIDADWALQLDLSSADNQVEMAVVLDGGPSDTPNPWNDLSYSTDPHTPSPTGNPADWYQFIGADSDFGDDPGPSQDYFVDFAYDLDTFYALTGLSDGDSIQVAFATSADHVGATKDLPDGGWSDVMVVPEPTALALLAIGCVTLAMRRRRVSAL